MAKARKLKVFKTPIGFHDAYVAAPSRKAALEAWGSGTDLFSAGIAEEVQDPKAMKAALARPGEVVRVGRSSGKEEGRPSPRPSPASERGRKACKPSRAALERAEKGLAALELRQSVERAELDKAEAALAKRRAALEAKQSKARADAEAKRDSAEAAYREKLRG